MYGCIMLVRGAAATRNPKENIMSRNKNKQAPVTTLTPNAEGMLVVADPIVEAAPAIVVAADPAAEAPQAHIEVAAPSTGKTGLTIEPNRAKQNGVTRPSAGGKCAGVWAECDRIVLSGQVPTLGMLRAYATATGTSPVTAQVQLYRFRAFAGIKTATVIAAPAVDLAIMSVC
jgi:hypothetical protein